MHSEKMKNLKLTRDSRKLKVCKKLKNYSRIYTKKLASFRTKLEMTKCQARKLHSLMCISCRSRHPSQFRDRDSRQKAALTIVDVGEKVAQRHPNPCWDRLPTVVMDKIFSQLDHKDWISSSLVCWNWREAFFHPRFWKKITFTLSDPEKIFWAINLAERFGRSVEYVTVKYYTSCSVSDFHQLLQHLCGNHNLRELRIEPTPATVTDKSIINFQPWINPILRSIQQIIQSSKQLKVLTLGFIEELVACADTLVDMLAEHHGRHLTQLELASVRRGQQIRQQAKLCRLTFERFESIKYLSLDYDDLNDGVLESLTSGTLERLVVHVHEPSKDHLGTSDDAWKAFREKNKRCELHLTFLRAHMTINVAQETILKPQMPLTHFTALFCESANLPLLNRLVIWYHQTLQSFIWLDSVNRDEFRLPTDDDDRNCYEYLTSFDERCRNLKELLYIGQVYDEFHTRQLCYVRLHIRGFLTHAEAPRYAQNDCLYNVHSLLPGLKNRLDRRRGNAAFQEVTKIIYDAMREKTENSEEIILSFVLRDTK